MTLACVTGRFQPVHDDHLRLFRQALAGAETLVVAVTNPDPGTYRAEPAAEHRHRADANPFTYFERLLLLTAAVGADPALAGRVHVVPFDLARPEHWGAYVPLDAVQHVGVYGEWEREKARRLAAAGYPVVEVPGDPTARRSGTAVRAALRAGSGWEELVPAATVPRLRGLLGVRGGRL